MRHARPTPLSAPLSTTLAATTLLALTAGPVAAEPGSPSRDAEAKAGGIPRWVVEHIADTPPPPSMEPEAVDELIGRAPYPGELRQIERDMRRLRFEHFRNRRHEETRREGIRKLRQYHHPSTFHLLLEIFEGEDEDVREALLDHFASQRSVQGDTTLAWAAIYGRDEALRDRATSELARRLGTYMTPPDEVMYVVNATLMTRNDDEVASAARLADRLGLAQAVPYLIQAQFGRQERIVDRTGRGALAWIMIGQQRAFISDLTPIVADSAVAFDPQLSVLTEGVLLRIMDAAVVEYRTLVHHSLVNLTSRLTGRSTSHLGYDRPAWQQWYLQEFLPVVRAREAEAADRERRHKTDSSAPESPTGDAKRDAPPPLPPVEAPPTDAGG